MKRLVLIGGVIGTLALGCVSAQGVTIGTAGSIAQQKQDSWCGAAWNWICDNNRNPHPACNRTGYNTRGYPQWLCFGGYSESSITSPGVGRDCSDEIAIDPYGTIVTSWDHVNCD